MKIRSCVFDLDGVIVDTDKFHFLAWRRLANELDFDLSVLQNDDLKGLRRRDTLDLILKWGELEMLEKEKIHWMNRKNDWYLEMVDSLKEGEAAPGVVDFICHLKDIGLHIALGSSSRNASIILDKLNITNLFDRMVDGNMVLNGKPHPETFLLAVEGTGIEPNEGIVFEDSVAGVTSAIRGGFYAVGIGEERALPDAHVVITDFVGINFSSVVARLFKNSID